MDRMKALTLLAVIGSCLKHLSAQQTDAARDQRGAGDEAYLHAALNPDGHLMITTTGGRTIVIPKAPGQTAFGEPVLSPDGTAIAAQALYPNCCTSYDLPLELVVHAAGQTRRFKGNGLPIFEWGYAESGKQVAYAQQPAHSGCVVHYELREIASGRLIDAVDVPQPCGQNWKAPPDAPPKLPTWVAELIERAE
jgi:hypothetical protein